jgi:hypothetical protein
VEDVFVQKNNHATTDPISLALVNAVLTLGSHHLNFQGDFMVSEKPAYDALVFFDRALKLRHQLISSEISIRNLQVSQRKTSQKADEQ